MLFKVVMIIVIVLWIGSIVLFRDLYWSVKDCDVLLWFVFCVLWVWIR